ncbi:ferritin [bacterium]|nr:ferritin [bacterium]
MLKALNKQVYEELASAYLYLSMNTYFKAEGFDGMANWMYKQWKEEISHAGKISEYINDRGGRVELEALPKPQVNWSSPLAAFKAAYKHERHISSCIHKLVELARKDGDLPTENMLAWFVSEQVEEEATAMDIVDKLEKIGDNISALYMYDSLLGQRE